MDAPLNTHLEDKENFSPSPPKPSYPKLPLPLPPSPLQPSRATSSPLLSYDQAKRPSQTPNTGCKRRALTALINSPPRASYADKVRGIYREPAPKLHRWDGFGMRRLSVTIPSSGSVRKEATPWSPLESESEREARWDAPRDSLGSASPGSGTVEGGRSRDSLVSQGPGVDERTVSPEQQAGPPVSPENALRDLEEACEVSAQTAQVRHEHHSIPQIQEPPSPMYDDSSDSWTGDDEFLPRSTRRQRRIDRRLNESPRAPQPFSAQLLRPQAPAYTGPNYPWPTALSKPSRFRAATPLSLYPQLPCSPADNRVSDADDEDSMSS